MSKSKPIPVPLAVRDLATAVFMTGNCSDEELATLVSWVRQRWPGRELLGRAEDLAGWVLKEALRAGVA